MGRPVWQYQMTPLNYGTYFYVIQYIYNLAGGITEHEDGLGDDFYQSFDGAGRVTQVGSNLSDSQHPNPLATTDSSNGYSPAGQIRQMLLGNGLTETAAYNNRLQPCRMNVNSSGTAYSLCTDSVPSNNIQDFSYGYNVGVSDNGNVAFWSATGAQSFSRNYAYDNVNRLLAFSASSDPTGCTGLSWTDDQWGNRTNQTVTGGTCGTFNQTVNTNNQFNSSPYQYDAAGNMTHDGSHIYYYDAENHLIQIDGTLGTCSTATACYVYDYGGRRVQRTLGGGTPANYLYDLDGHVNSEIDLANGSFDNSNHKLGWVASYIYLGGSLLAEYANSTTYFVHKDHLGSTRLMTNMTGCVVDNLDYLPYGELYSYTPSCSAPDIALKFTGKERDSESGLDNFGARYMSSQYGRFMSPDPTRLSAFFDDPQTWNMYIYAHNNPLAYVDRNGKWPTPIHNQIYTAALAQALTPEQMQIVQSVSAGQDSILGGGQFNSVAFEHAMRGPDQSIMQAETQYNSFVSGQVQAAQEAQIKFWKANPGSHSLSDEALVHFAMALHAVADSTSPAHAGFQLWDWRNPLLIWRHMQNEKSITPAQLQTAVSASQGLFDQTFGMFGFDEFDLLELQQQQQQQQQQEQVTSQICSGLDENGNCIQ